MPSIPVVPALDDATLDGSGPVLAGVEFRRANSRTVTWEAVRNTITLAGGVEKAYSDGLRRVVELKWSRMTGDEVAQLRQILTLPFISYADDSTADNAIYGHDGLQADAIPASVPVVHAVTLTLRAQTPTR